MKLSAKAKMIADRAKYPKELPKPESTSKWLWIVPGGLGTCMLLAMVLAGVGTWALMEYVVWNHLPANLVGKWVVVGGEQDGATFDFYRSGKLIAHLNGQGNELILDAQVAVEADRLFITTRHPQTGQEDTKTHTIKVLTSNRLVLQDERKNTYNMERAN